MQFSSDTHSAGITHDRTQPNRFLDHMQQLFGDDPDPIFLAESWALGVTAATENLHHRRNQQNDYEYHQRALQELYRMVHLEAAFPFPSEPILPKPRPKPQPQPKFNSHSDSDIQLDSALYADPVHDPGAKGDRAHDTPIARAHRLLGVAPDATHDEVRSAYRRQVGLCHPDRQTGASEAVRRRATEQMSELNQAYHLLSAASFAEAA